LCTPGPIASHSCLQVFYFLIYFLLHRTHFLCAVASESDQTHLGVGWLLGGLESFIPDLEFPMQDNTIVVCFQSHLAAGLGLPPSKFLVSILNFLKCKLVHLNLNVIATLSCFTMLYECWLMIAPHTCLFSYYYSSARYEKTVFSGIVLSLHRHRQQEYLDATFRGSQKGTSQKWFLIGMHTAPQWTNKHLLPPHIDDKQREPKMTPCMQQALVNRVAELHQAGLRACHCAEEFTLQRIHPLGRWEKLAYECSRFAGPCHEPADGKIFKLLYC
jgi:hypothetical protein